MGNFVGLVQDESSDGILAGPEIAIMPGFLDTRNNELGSVVRIGVNNSAVDF